MARIDTLAEELSVYINAMKLQSLSDQLNFFDSEAGNLSLKEATVIMLLGGMGSCKMRDLADSIRVAYSTMTGITDKLVKLRYVERNRIEEDRRVVLVALTGRGKALSKWINEKSIEVIKYMLSLLDKNEQESFYRIYRKIWEKMKESRSPLTQNESPVSEKSL